MNEIWGGHKQCIGVNRISKHMEAGNSIGCLRDKQKFGVAGTYHVGGVRETVSDVGHGART